MTLKVENMNIKTINQNIKLSSWKLRSSTKITKLKSWGQNHQPRPSNKKEDVQIYEFSLLNVKNMSIKTINWIHQFFKKRIKIVNCWHWEQRTWTSKPSTKNIKLRSRGSKPWTKTMKSILIGLKQSIKTIESRKKG